LFPARLDRYRFRISSVPSLVLSFSCENAGLRIPCFSPATVFLETSLWNKNLPWPLIRRLLPRSAARPWAPPQFHSFRRQPRPSRFLQSEKTPCMCFLFVSSQGAQDWFRNVSFFHLFARRWRSRFLFFLEKPPLPNRSADPPFSLLIGTTLSLSFPSYDPRPRPQAIRLLSLTSIDVECFLFPFPPFSFVTSCPFVFPSSLQRFRSPTPPNRLTPGCRTFVFPSLQTSRFLLFPLFLLLRCVCFFLDRRDASWQQGRPLLFVLRHLRFRFFPAPDLMFSPNRQLVTSSLSQTLSPFSRRETSVLLRSAW